MEGFKSFKKVQCFKDGGSVQKEVNFTKRDRKVVDEADIAQDKKIVKKAFSIHDSQQHEEKTDLKSLKKGGRSKKETGTVKKYKTGGSVTNVYEAKKKSGDLDNIKAVKDTKAVKLCGGKSVKKYADGGGIMDAIGNVGTQLKNNVMGTPEQNRIAQAQMDKVKARKAAQAAALMQGQSGAGALQQGALAGGLAPAAAVNPMGDATGVPPMKKGGKIKKYADGGSISETDDMMSKLRGAKIKPVEMPSGRNSGGTDIPGIGRVKPVEMPSGRNSGGTDIPGIGRVKPVEMPYSVGREQRFKKGGKSKK